MSQSTIFVNSKLVATVPKNKLEEIKVSVLKNNMVDIRVNFFFPNDPVSKPTKKGIWISFKDLPAIIETFEELIADQNKEVNLEFQKSDSQKIRVYTDEYRRNKLIQIRTYYLQDNEYKPGKGVSFPRSVLPQMIVALKQSLDFKE